MEGLPCEVLAADHSTKFCADKFWKKSLWREQICKERRDGIFHWLIYLFFWLQMGILWRFLAVILRIVFVVIVRDFTRRLGSGVGHSTKCTLHLRLSINNKGRCYLFFAQVARYLSKCKPLACDAFSLRHLPRRLNLDGLVGTAGFPWPNVARVPL